MQYQRTFLSGTIVWILIFLTFTIMNFIPILQNNTSAQNGVILILIVPITLIGNRYYYVKQNKLNGFKLGFIISCCCLLLDAIITLPLVIIPKGGSYSEFYTDIGLVVIGFEILLVSYFYWRMKIK